MIRTSKTHILMSYFTHILIHVSIKDVEPFEQRCCLCVCLCVCACVMSYYYDTCFFDSIVVTHVIIIFMIIIMIIITIIIIIIITVKLNQEAFLITLSVLDPHIRKNTSKPINHH